MKQTKLQKRIMRRVYYSYSIAVASHKMFWQGAVLGACIALFGRLTHVASIAHNMLAVPVKEVPSFVSGAFLHAAQSGEVMTVLVSLGIIGFAISVTYQVLPILTRLLRQEVARA